MYPSTLYTLATVPPDVPPDMVRAAALVDGVPPGPAAAAALEVLADPAARADYDRRADRGLAHELALAWGVAAMAAGDYGRAQAHFQRASGLNPGDRAVAVLLKTLPKDAATAARTEPDRESARGEIARVVNNSAFPHRLVRYATALAGEGTPASAAQPAESVGAARDLLERDITEAPRSYAMVLPVLREHYQAVYALDDAFFDATASVLADHAPAAEYERGKRRYGESHATPALPPEPLPDLDLSTVSLPPLRFQDRRLNWALLGRVILALAGAAAGAWLVRDNPPGVIAVAAAAAFALVWYLSSRLAARKR